VPLLRVGDGVEGEGAERVHGEDVAGRCGHGSSGVRRRSGRAARVAATDAASMTTVDNVNARDEARAPSDPERHPAGALPGTRAAGERECGCPRAGSLLSLRRGRPQGNASRSRHSRCLSSAPAG
jgi:hypothetical protein